MNNANTTIAIKALYQWRAQRARQVGQSVIVAIIVLFLLLFLAGIFVGIIAGNIKNTQRASTTSAAGRFAEAGIKYLDEQLTKSPQGADWRNVPDCAYGVACTNISQSDPDINWLKPCGPGVAEPCGYTRVNFGSEIRGAGNSGAGNSGGRALVKVTYAPNVQNPLSRYMRLDSVGRAGQVIPEDPTTYKNSEALGQRVELLAYKAINLNEYAIQVTNKNKKPGSVSLGMAYPIRDRGNLRNIENIIIGPVRVNAGLNFYGVNRIALNPFLNQSLEVAGPITMNGVAENASAVTVTDPTQVFINTVGLANNITPATPNLLPSNSPLFTTFGREVANANPAANNAFIGLVRDNPRGNETGGLPNSFDNFGNQYENLRSVGYVSPPQIDEPISDNGTTRYRELTRNAPAMAPRYMTANPLGGGTGLRDVAGNIGWGAGLYINNSLDVQQESEGLIGGYSLRGDWMTNAGKGSALSFGSDTFWRGDSIYVPPAVTITLYPRYFTIESYAGGNRRQAYTFRRPTDGARLRDVRKILRYTGLGGRLPFPQGYGTGVEDNYKFEGYPADAVPGSSDVFAGEFVIFAEGNIRIRGAVGGLDPESGAYFKRHLTVVSNANIYIDGNLLRDNITTDDTSAGANAVRGQSTIALLAKQNVCVNTTQFLSPQNQEYNTEDQSGNGSGPFAFKLTSNPGGRSEFLFRTNFAPILNPNTGLLETPPYLNGAGSAPPPALFLRHGSASADGAIIYAFANYSAVNTPNLLDFGPLGFPTATSLTLSRTGNPSIPTGYYFDRFNIPLNFLYPTNPFPAYGQPVVGTDNLMGIAYDSTQSGSAVDYYFSRFGIAPLDIRIEALMYAQEGAFFIIPGPWFNPNKNDTFESFVDPNSPTAGRRQSDEDVTTNPRRRVNALFPFYKEPMDVRITFCGSINQNLPAEIADQSAWMEKWGWIPEFYGSTGLTEGPNFPDQGAPTPTVHGPNPNSLLRGPNNTGNGIVYEYDTRAILPYGPTAPLRPNPYNPTEPLPFAPNLPVAPGLMYYGQNPVR
jgi:hypothetical protein